MLTARRGLGIDELRLIDPRFAAAVRFALFAEKLADGIGRLRAEVKSEPPASLQGKAFTDFTAMRAAMRADLKQRDEALYPPDVSDG